MTPSVRSAFVASAALLAAGALPVAARAADDPKLAPCALITPPEASTLLGEPAGQASPDPAAPGCVIGAHDGGGDHVTATLATVSPQDVGRLLKHLDEARGDDVPSLHGEPWYEQSAIDPDRPHDRVFVIWRDRTSLTLDLSSARQDDAHGAFERVWLDVAMRLPKDPAP